MHLGTSINLEGHIKDQKRTKHDTNARNLLRKSMRDPEPIERHMTGEVERHEDQLTSI
jgi:hypothetical protein